jgi:hypothetical protein
MSISQFLIGIENILLSVVKRISLHEVLSAPFSVMFSSCLYRLQLYTT